MSGDAEIDALAEALNRAERLLRNGKSGRAVAVVPDGDADGLAAGAIAFHVLKRIGASPRALHPGKGEHVHTPAVQARLRRARPAAIVALDLGSRAGAIVPGVPTVVVDHHVPRGLPDGAVVLNGHRLDPIPSTSQLAFALFHRLGPAEDLEWLAQFGTFGDYGAEGLSARFPDRRIATSRKALSEAVAMVNAARRSAAHDTGAAFEVLLAAQRPEDIASLRVPGAAALQALREEINAEVARCSRTAPRMSGPFALIEFSSGAKVHPLVAQRWKGRLKDRVVIAANHGYLPGRVNFAMRTARDEDLISVLRSLPLPEGAEAGYGHARATGGSLSFRDFEVLKAAMGFHPPRPAQGPALGT